MADKRIINVNPDIFNIPDSTKKKRPTKNDNNIKVKQPNIKQPRNKTIKRKLLNYIRNRQKEKLKEYDSVLSEKEPNIYLEDFESDFKNSINYLENIVEKNNQPTSNNHTFKNYPSFTNENVSMEFPTTPNINLDSLNDVSKDINQSHSNLPAITIQKPPEYGCLKNGSLPTYRNWRNTTHKNYEPIHNSNTPSNTPQVSNHNTISNTPQISNHNPISNNNNISTTNKILPTSPLINPEFKNTLMNDYNNKNIQKKKKKYRRKIIKRNFTIGRSKKHPKVSVLISNKTIRKNIYTNKTLLQQSSIDDIRKHLIKRGFIKVGSIAPNNVLRHMYENIMTICGDVYNHNPKNLLYNYFNYKEE